jgi:hypothetical protein
MFHFPLHSNFFHSLLRHDRRNSLLSACFTSFVLPITRSERSVRYEMSHEAVLQLVLITTHRIQFHLLCMAKGGLHLAKTSNGHTIVRATIAQ